MGRDADSNSSSLSFAWGLQNDKLKKQDFLPSLVMMGEEISFEKKTMDRFQSTCHLYSNRFVLGFCDCTSVALY